MQGFTITAEEMAEYESLKSQCLNGTARVGRMNETMTAAVGAVNGNARLVSGGEQSVQAIDEDKMSKLTQHLADIITKECNTDEEQFILMSKLRNRMAEHWDREHYQSTELSGFHKNRAQTLGKFIEMTASR